MKDSSCVSSRVECTHVDAPVPEWWCWAAAGRCRPRSPGAGCYVPRSASLHRSGWDRTSPRLTLSVNHSIANPRDTLHNHKDVHLLKRLKAQTDQLFIQQRTPVDLLRQIQTQHLIVHLPVDGAVLRPAIVKISHAVKTRSQSSISQRVGSSTRQCGNDTLLASISRWHVTYRVLGVSAGMRACFCVFVCDTPE